MTGSYMEIEIWRNFDRNAEFFEDNAGMEDSAGASPDGRHIGATDIFPSLFGGYYRATSFCYAPVGDGYPAADYEMISRNYFCMDFWHSG